MPSNTVRVINSARVIVSRTDFKRAKRMVARGIARWRGDAVEMIAGDHRVSATGCAPLKQRQIYINGDGFASLDAIKGLPVAGDTIRLLMGNRPAQPPRDLPTVEISRRALPSLDPPALVPLWKGEPLVAT